MAYLPSLPDHASLLDVFRMFPETNEPLLSFHEILLRGPSPFTEAERELIAAYVSGLNGCRYCHGVHTATAERLGIAPGTIAALLDGDTSIIPHKMVPVLDFAKKLTQSAKGGDEGRRRCGIGRWLGGNDRLPFGRCYCALQLHEQTG
jgi:AhpD family alkylhydroperoxidase